MIQDDQNTIKRRRMVDEQLRSRGIQDERVLAVMEAVPRERFLPPDAGDTAFADRALPIECDQTISQPYMVGAMTAHLHVEPHHRVLEIGTGSGYQAAVLAHLAAEVYTIERVPELTERARRILTEIGIDNVHFRVGDGTLGWPEHAPFERIIVTAGAPDVPRPLLEQLTDGGRIVVPVGSQSEQILTVVERIGDRTREIPGIPCRFVKLIGDQAWGETAE